MNDRSHNRVPFYFVLATALLDCALAFLPQVLPQRPDTILLLTSILGLSIAQMALCLIVMMRQASYWKIHLCGVIVSLAFGLTVTVGPWSAPFDRIVVILVTTLLFGITPVAIYRVFFGDTRVQFSLFLLFGLMTLVTVVCAAVVQINPDWQWFLTYLFLFICTSIPILLAGFMLVGRRTASKSKYVMIMLVSIVVSTIIAISTEQSASDVSLVGQINGFMSLYLLIGGIVLSRDAALQMQSPQAVTAPLEEDPIAAE